VYIKIVIITKISNVVLVLLSLDLNFCTKSDIAFGLYYLLVIYIDNVLLTSEF
jgi:hypothetical protein